MSTNHKHPTLGVVLALASSLLFGLNASTTKVLVQSGITPAQLVLFRSIAVATIAALALLVTNRAAFRISRREVVQFAIYGVLGIALMQWAYSNAVSTMQVGPALLIEYTSVVMVPLATLLIFKDRVHKRIWMAVALVLGGLVIVAHPWNSWLNPVGVAWAFMAAVMLSIYFIMGERLQRTRDPLSTLFYSFATASIFWLIASALTGGGFVRFSGQVPLTGALAPASLPTWALLLWVAVMASFAPMFFTVLALRHLSAAGVGIASTAETVFAFVFGYLWLSERIDVAQAIGASVVIVGIVLAQTARSAKWQL